MVLKIRHGINTYVYENRSALIHAMSLFQCFPPEAIYIVVLTLPPNRIALWHRVTVSSGTWGQHRVTISSGMLGQQRYGTE